MCHRCGRSADGERVGFRAICEGCGAYLHACLNCAHHDRDSYRECRAAATTEFVGDKEKANFCEEFRPRSAGGAETGKKSRRDIEKLFEGGSS